MRMAAILPFVSLLAAFLWCWDLTKEVRFIAPKPALRAPAVDLDAREAIALTQDWRLAGDDKPVAQRLAAAALNPYSARAWSAERTEEGSYLVIFREPAGTPVYAFEVSLETESVQATPEAVDRLTILRVREESESRPHLMARAD